MRQVVLYATGLICPTLFDLLEGRFLDYLLIAKRDTQTLELSIWCYNTFKHWLINGGNLTFVGID
jgi:hypothetical protein